MIALSYIPLLPPGHINLPCLSPCWKQTAPDKRLVLGALSCDELMSDRPRLALTGAFHLIHQRRRRSATHGNFARLRELHFFFSAKLTGKCSWRPEKGNEEDAGEASALSEGSPADAAQPLSCEQDCFTIQICAEKATAEASLTPSLHPSS